MNGLSFIKQHILFACLCAALVGLTLFTLYQITHVVLLGLLALLAALGIIGLTRQISRVLGVSYNVAYGALLALVIGVLIAAIWLFSDWIGSISVNIGGQLQAVQTTVVATIEDSQLLPNDAVDQITTQLQGFVSEQGMFSQVASGIGSAATAATQAVLVILVAAYIAAAPAMYKNGLIRLMPHNYKQPVRTGITTTYHTLLRWFVARLLSMTVVGVLTYIGLLLLGVPYAGVLALLAFTLSFIPNLGPILSVVPAALVGLSIGVTLMVYVLVLYLIVQTVESNLITPLIEQKLVSTPPALLLITQLAAGSLFGLLGILLAAPVLATVVALVNQSDTATD